MRVILSLMSLAVTRIALGDPGGAVGAASGPALSLPVATAASELSCSGEYADDLLALAPAARDFDRAQAPFTFCVRSSATYECPSYGQDGSLRRTRRRVVAHGTGFGLRASGSDTLIATNEHVSEWPAVTDAAHAVEDIPPGCKRVSSTLRIVDDEGDAYERDDVPLTRVVTDARLDVSLLRAAGTLPVLPWKLGHSAALRERNAVDIRGFPLGVLRAHNAGKIVSAYDHDDDHDWDHVDFVVDAPLSPGNSGSPVLAVSCRTHEFELVGIYHARYVDGGALHEVIAIDQLRDLLTTAKRSPRAHAEATAPLGPAARERLLAAARAPPALFFPFGPVTAAAHARGDGALVFELLEKHFPVRTTPALVLEDLPLDSGFGRLGRIWTGNRQGLREVARSELDAETHGLLAKALEAFRHDALAALEYREAVRLGNRTREDFQRAKRLERSVEVGTTSRQDLAQALLDLAEQLCPRSAEATASLGDVLSPPSREATALAASAGKADVAMPILLAPASVADTAPGPAPPLR